jgi:type IV secretory pathway VirB4 component
MIALRTRRPAHSATSAHLCAAYPFLADDAVGRSGVYIGRDAYGRAFAYDGFLLYPRLISSPNMIVCGEIGTRKSTFVKTFVHREIPHGRQGFILDVKGEYAGLARAAGVAPLVFSPGGGQQLNAIDPRMGRDGQLTLLRSVAKATLRRELRPEEDAALRVALDHVNAAASGAEPTLSEVVDALLRPGPAMVAGVSATSTGELAASCRQVALALQRLCDGELRGMFDGPTSGAIDLDAPLVVLDFSRLADNAAIDIAMTCAMASLRAVFTERKRTAEAEGRSGRQMIFVIEEGWRLTGNIGTLEHLQQMWKLCRAWGIQNILVVHRLADLGASGSDGSREAKIAEGLLSDAETKVVFRQPPDQLEALRSQLGCTRSEAELVTGARPGEALWLVGTRSALVAHRISGIEREIVFTDHRMGVAG